MAGSDAKVDARDAPIEEEKKEVSAGQQGRQNDNRAASSGADG